jgi:hypothetical protein
MEASDGDASSGGGAEGGPKAAPFDKIGCPPHIAAHSDDEAMEYAVCFIDHEVGEFCNPSVRRTAKMPPMSSSPWPRSGSRKCDG